MRRKSCALWKGNSCLSFTGFPFHRGCSVYSCEAIVTVSIVAQTVTKKTPLPFLHSSALLMFSASLYLSHLTLLSDIWKMLLTPMVHFLVQRLKSDLFFEVQSLERLKGEKKI